MNAPRPKCPRCGQELLPIAYGLPSAQMRDAAARGEIALGGCIVGPDVDRWRCKACAADLKDAEVLNA